MSSQNKDTVHDEAVENWKQSIEIHMAQSRNSIENGQILKESAQKQIANLKEYISILDKFIAQDLAAIEINKKQLADYEQQGQLQS